MGNCFKSPDLILIDESDIDTYRTDDENIYLHIDRNNYGSLIDVKLTPRKIEDNISNNDLIDTTTYNQFINKKIEK